MSANVPPLEAALAQVSEFPERMGPVLIKELRQGLRSGLFVQPFVILPGVLALVAVWALSIDHLANARNSVAVFFWGAVIVPVLFITPLRALGAIRSEREAQTLDLLQLTPLSAWRIVVAKWSSLVAQSLLWVMAMLPFLVLRYFFGGMNLTEEAASLFWLVVAGAGLTGCALVVSTLPRFVFWLSVVGMAFIGLTGFWTLMVALFSRSAFTRMVGPGSSLPSLAGQLLLLGLTVHLTGLALAFAASRIAPPADNYALRLRGGALALFSWFGLASFLLPSPDQNSRWVFLAIAVVGTTLVTIIDLASNRAPLLPHVRTWTRWGPVGIFVGRAFLPGWPGAVVFFSGVTVLATGIALFLSKEPFALGAGALVFWSAVLLPRATQCLLATRAAGRPGLHVVLHLAGLVVTAVLAAFSSILGGALLVPAAMMPSALGWLLLFQALHLESIVGVIAIIGAVWLLILSAVLAYHARGHEKILQQHLTALRRPRQPAEI